MTEAQAQKLLREDQLHNYPVEMRFEVYTTMLQALSREVDQLKSASRDNWASSVNAARQR